MDEFICIDESTLTRALSEDSNNTNEEYIDTLDEIYGERIDEEKIIQVAKIQIASVLNLDISDFSSVDTVKLGEEIKLYDANDMNTFVAFNYTTCDNRYGYIVISTHTKAPLVKEMVEDTVLPVVKGKVYYFSEGEFYFQKGMIFKMLDDNIISRRDFAKLKCERVKKYYFFTKNLLASIELDTIAMLNNITYLVENTDSEGNLDLGGTTYSGQVGYGYGGISSPVSYLKDRYGGTITAGSSPCLTMNSFICKDWEDGENCTVVAITRILSYYYKQGYTKLPSSYTTIYKKVKEVATKYGYDGESGTPFSKINNIINDVLSYYGYTNSYSSGVYAWTFSNNVKKEIDALRPTIMNIARGYYGNHSVTVCGYSIFKSKNGLVTKTHNLICVYDGWDRAKRYIDYEAFAYDLISAGFGSFNTVIMKK